MSATPQQRAKPQTHFARDFSGGVNVGTSRDAIEDNQAWWMEGLIPLGPGNLTVTNGPTTADSGGWHTAVAGESGAPSFVFTFNTGGSDYFFVVWANSGNGYVGLKSGFGVTKIFAGVLTSGQTAAAPWNNSGILIVDPVGYWDWNITTAATLTALNNSLQSITITDGGSGYTSCPNVTLTGGGGSGATVTVGYLGLGSLTVAATGANYKVGDVLSYSTFLTPIPASINVTTVNATGGITGWTVNTQGHVFNPGGNPVAFTGGSGTGFTANVTWVVSAVNVGTRGSGYTSAPLVGFVGGGATRTATATANVSGSLVGTSIAVGFGRAWIANGRTVTFSDADSFASFIGSGSQFTITDDYLHIGINALFFANGYLYIFGDDSIDVLSNVTVTSAGTASFSRVNVTSSIGTSQPNSIFAYYRSVAFANQQGFYLLSGSTPEKISDALNLLMPNIIMTAPYNVFGAQCTVAGELCAAWSFTFTDNFVGNGLNSSMLALYFRGRWFFARPAINGTPLTFTAMASVAPQQVGVQAFTLYTFDSTPQFYKLFPLALSPSQTYWRLWTKLYDCGSPMTQKQATRAAVGLYMGNSVFSRAGLSFTVDTENHSTGGQTTTLPSGTFNGYKRFMANNNEGDASGAQFMGWGLNGVGATQADVTRIDWLALEYAEVGSWLAA